VINKIEIKIDKSKIFFFKLIEKIIKHKKEIEIITVKIKKGCKIKETKMTKIAPKPDPTRFEKYIFPVGNFVRAMPITFAPKKKGIPRTRN